MPSNLIWLDGRIATADAFHLAPDDEAILYGRGVFQTTRTVAGLPWLWDRHLQSILRHAGTLAIPVTEGDLPTVKQIRDWVDELGVGDVVVRLNVAALGTGARFRVWAIHRPLMERTRPLRLAISPYFADRSDAMACLKSFNYLARHLSFKTAIERGCDDAVIISSGHEVLETAHGNLFAFIDGQWQTPPAGGGMLPGTVRALLLENATQTKIVEQRITTEQLRAADEVVVTNSVHGIMAVESIEDSIFHPAEATKSLGEYLSSLD